MEASLFGGLIEPGLDLDKERSDLQGLVDEKGPGWVWRNRQRLMAEQMFIRKFLKKNTRAASGCQSMISIYRGGLIVLGAVRPRIC